MKIIIVSDFHGNEQHMAALGDAVVEEKPDVLFYLGDFTPNRFVYDTPDKADDYNMTVFFPSIVDLPVPLKYVIPGNTDFETNKYKYSELFKDPKQCCFVCAGVRPLNKHIDCFFYSYTKLSPHSLKDGE